MVERVSDDSYNPTVHYGGKVSYQINVFTHCILALPVTTWPITKCWRRLAPKTIIPDGIVLFTI